MRTSLRRWLVVLVCGLFMTVASVGPVAAAASASGSSSTSMVLSGSGGGISLSNVSVLSFSQQVTAPRDVATGQASGKRQHKPITIRKELDKASPLLMRAMAGGVAFPTLTLTITAPGVKDASITLSGATISDITTGDLDGDGWPEELVSFTYQKITWNMGDGSVFEDTWSDLNTEATGPVSYRMAINEKGVPSKKKPNNSNHRVLAQQVSIISPRDAQSGLPTGKRQHSPVIVMTDSATSIPELTQAYVAGRPLETVTVATYDANDDLLGYVQLTNVMVSSMQETSRSFVLPHVLERRGALGASSSNPLYEDVADYSGPDCTYELTYQRIEWKDASGQIIAMDDWESDK